MRPPTRRLIGRQNGLLDRWTLVHFAYGVAAGLMLPPWIVVLAGVAYEMAERRILLDPRSPFGAVGPESLGNQVVDVLATWVGAAAMNPVREEMRGRWRWTA